MFGIGGKAKYFFWSMVLAGAAMVASSFSPTLMSGIKSRVPASVQELGSTISLNGGGEDTVEPPSNSITYKGEQYVLIEGKYYPYQKSNTYDIDGRKVYYRDNSQDRYKDTKVGKGRSIVDKIKDVNPMSAYNPGNTADMMKTLKEAQANMKNKDKFLKEMLKNQ